MSPAAPGEFAPIFAGALATDGVNVVVADYAKEAAEKVAAEIRTTQGVAIAVKVDVGDPESVAEMMRQAIAKYGQIDYAFCGAGIMDRIPVIDMPEEVWHPLMRINRQGSVSRRSNRGETHDAEKRGPYT